MISLRSDSKKKVRKKRPGFKQKSMLKRPQKTKTNYAPKSSLRRNDSKKKPRKKRQGFKRK